MTYLSCSTSDFDNFTLLANNTATMTEEYDQALKELNKEEFPAKVRALEITAVALVILGILVAATVSIIPGIILACMTIFPLIGLKYQLDRQTVLLSKLEHKTYDIDVIFNNIIGYLKIHQEHKADILIIIFNQTNTPKFHGRDEEDKAKNQLRTYENYFDQEKIVFIDPAHAKQCHEYATLIPLAQSILSRNAPPTLPSDRWKKLQKACFLFLHGQGSIYPFIHGEQWSKFELYIKLEKDPQNVFKWVAMKY